MHPAVMAAEATWAVPHVDSMGRGMHVLPCRTQVFFGWNLNALNKGTVAVGDEIIIKKKRTAALAA